MTKFKLPKLIFFYILINGAQSAVLRCQKALTFWQISDIHLDVLYDIKGDPIQFCHKNKSYENTLGKFGDFRCEANWDLLKSSFELMKQENANPDFFLWTGDSSPHWKKPSPPNWEYIFGVEKTLVELFREYFPNVTVLPVMGNHDSSPPDYFPDNSDFYSKYLRESAWTKLIPDSSSQSEFSKCGFYRHKDHLSNITFLLLNTNLYYSNNNTGKDICGQLEWMRNEFEEAEKEIRQVIIVSHVPPGYFERDPFGPFFKNIEGDHHMNEDYVKLLEEFSSTILGQIYGHTHTDTFRVVCKNETKCLTALIAPSLTPIVAGTSSTNPGVRLYSYVPGKLHLEDYAQYYLDLVESNVKEIPVWSKLYDFKSFYGKPDLSAKSLREVFDMLSTNDTFFQRHYLLNTLGKNNGDCGSKCKRDFLCAMHNFNTDNMEDCLNSKIDTNLKIPFQEEDAYKLYDDLTDWEIRKIRRQAFASKIVSYILAFIVIILILLYTLHLVQMCRNSAYLRITDE